MVKRVSQKSRAMMGAAAAALFATSSFGADTPVEDASLRTAIKNILRLPTRAPSMRAPSMREVAATKPVTPPRVNLISIGNTDDITVGDDQSAIAHEEIWDDINVTNTGALTGGIGIDVTTGAIDLTNTVSDDTYALVMPGNYELLFDVLGNPVYSPYGFQEMLATAEVTVNARSTVLARDPRESTITIDNGGAIGFSGLHGIRAHNPAGESITIENSGDITATQDTAGRSGIFASTESIQQQYTQEQTGTGDFVRNAHGQLVAVNTPDQFTVETHLVDMEYDAGVIDIRNSGDIDMGATIAPPAYGSGSLASAGIYTRGDGGTTIVNSGDINVDKWSAGIHVSSTATTNVTNTGRIEIGNYSSGISFGPSQGSAGDYRLGGDVYLLNAGDIVGGVTKEQAAADGLDPNAFGISVFALGSNNEYLAAQAHINEIFARYNEELGSEAYELFDIPNTRLYQTTAINRGHIELGDGAGGIAIIPRAGASTAINEGTIIVGDGTSVAWANFQHQSTGIIQSNFSMNGLGSTTSINAEGGVIVTGDDSAGIANFNIGGTSLAINEGSITVGNGVSTLVDDGINVPFDRLFISAGIQSISAARTFGTTSTARNSGDITVGELAIGMVVSGQGYSLLDIYTWSAINENSGVIETGDNSSGMFTMGTNSTTTNSGSIDTGNFDISAFQPHPEYTADEFAQLPYGAASTGFLLAQVVNSGSITTGDGTVGASARMENPGFGIAAQVINAEGGIVDSGDHSVGARAVGNIYGFIENAGTISVGSDSVGAEVSAGGVAFIGEPTALITQGFATAVNSGIIETGDDSTGFRLNAVHVDVPYSGQILVPPTPDYPYYSYMEVSGTADSIGGAYLVNAGTITVGANSTGVEISGLEINEQGLHVFNTGAIDAASGTALRVNEGHAFDSYVVNVGEIAGDIRFGDGNDRLTNTLFVDNTGRIVSTGVLTLNDTVIDFGGGDDLFDNDRGVIVVAGGDNLITGANVLMTEGVIEARNGAVDSLLTIDGNVSGGFTFGADIGNSAADQLHITGNVADGSDMTVVLNPTGQMRGETRITIMTIDGENLADDPVIAGVTGIYADSLQNAEVGYSAQTGEVFVTASFGMGHMATSAVSATTMAQNWWMHSAGSLDERNLQQLAGLENAGISAWASVFHEEGTVTPDNEFQDASFDQKLSGLQTGVEWSRAFAGGTFGLGAMFSQGDASANMNANLASARGDASAYGLGANYRHGRGFYVNATWQSMTMDVDFRAPGTFSNATGTTEAEGDGFSAEIGYAHKLSSGLTLAPQVQYATVDVEMDDFTSSDDVYVLSGLGGKHSLLRAGISVFKTFETTNGSITPIAELSYLDVMDGESGIASNGVSFATDTSGSGYQFELGIAGRYKAWDISGRLGMADTSATDQSLSTNLTVRYRW